MCDWPADIREVLILIKKLKTCKAAGVDEIRPSLINKVLRQYYLNLCSMYLILYLPQDRFLLG